ncbi:cytochrome c/c1 heme-lyase [Dichotomocladium elegans]|nr:cytochrome c/c1 heme-lyase [Dichotomocladium elegans]
MHAGLPHSTRRRCSCLEQHAKNPEQSEENINNSSIFPLLPMENLQQQQQEQAAKCPVDHTQFSKPAAPKEGTTCPVDHSTYKHFLPSHPDKSSESSTGSNVAAAATTATATTDAASVADKCPVDPAAYKHFVPKSTEGCDSSAIDARNNMPAIAEQKAHADQKIPLSTEREVSNIPRADAEESKWIYPSEQMFFNAMRRKNWNPEEKDMSVVVPIHNAVNEQAWVKILEWENMHKTECNQPKLVKFQGRPKDITPKARIRSWFGYTLPFDRHDWVVDRCGEKVTYVIDFYTGKQNSTMPGAVSFYLDVRPAATPAGIWDRLKMSWKRGEFV